ncbi:hypothetical protein PHMEG_00030904 [Phytophthora megakarya]|uniref:PiggyBac transposable element-derived protein domain-containing protein n=1 Tax=Phytophthora megakarya TaxID=4795 RepID=A0A225UZD2_9STRA|nr:hypothetical protein PHMEG_00030904 [Phytophthora megakarya]
MEDANPDVSVEPRETTTDAEESKSETDDPPISWKVQQEKLFGPIAEDDVNIVSSAEWSDSDSDADDEDVMADNDVIATPIEGVDDIVEPMNDDDDDNDTEELGMTEEYLREMAETGWTIYDERQSGKSGSYRICNVVHLLILYCMIYTGNLQLSAATDYYNGQWGPTRSAIAFADSPLGMFFYFLPKHCGSETNQYREQNITAVATSRRNKLLARQAQDPRVSVPNLEEIEDRLSRFKRIQAYEIVHVIALLFARAIAPIRDGLAKHWCVDEDGAIPRGTFSRFMKRDRFEEILKFLHFNNNLEIETRSDKARKIRPILQAVERTFRRGYRLGKVISFDEGMMSN